MIMFKGGLTYADFLEMPIPEIDCWISTANEITEAHIKANKGARTKSTNETTYTG